MPKIVDPTQRRQEIIEAMMRLVAHDGFAAASVRNVAKEAGLSTGSLRHYFDSQVALMHAAAETVINRITTRVEQSAAVARTFDDWVAVLEQLVPLDDERLREFQVWLALANEGRTDATLGALSGESYSALREACIGVLGELGVPSEAAREEAAVLHAVLDGLSLHLVLYPHLMSPEQARSALHAHLRLALERSAAAGTTATDAPGSAQAEAFA